MKYSLPLLLPLLLKHPAVINEAGTFEIFKSLFKFLKALSKATTAAVFGVHCHCGYTMLISYSLKLNGGTGSINPPAVFHDFVHTWHLNTQNTF